MHVRELVEMAAWVAAHAPGFIRSNRLLLTRNIQGYWSASKTRLDDWGRSIKNFESRCLAKHPSKPPQAASAEVRAVMEEILAAEVLTRVWTATADAYDRQRLTREIEPVVRSVYRGHMEARRRVLKLMVHGHGVLAEEAVALNRLRRRAERWTDLLLARITVVHDVAEFAFDPRRVQEFADEPGQEGEAGDVGWQLTLGSLRAAFQPGLAETAASPEANRKIASSIVACFRHELFDSTGPLQSLWLDRLSTTAADTQNMIEQLLAIDGDC